MTDTPGRFCLAIGAPACGRVIRIVAGTYSSIGAASPMVWVRSLERVHPQEAGRGGGGQGAA